MTNQSPCYRFVDQPESLLYVSNQSESLYRVQVRQVTASELELIVGEHQYVAVFFCKLVIKNVLIMWPCP